MSTVMLINVLYRGEEFRTEYARLGEMRSVFSSNVNIMALTATATVHVRETVLSSLSMTDPVIVSVSPDKLNMTYMVSSFWAYCTSSIEVAR